MSCKVQIEHVTFSYRNAHEILKEFQYDFHSGKLYLLLAGNGSGKSTLLKLITKVLLKPKKGRVIHSNTVSYFAETVSLPSMITTKEYLSLTSKLVNHHEKTVREWMKEWNLPIKLIHQCSKGNQQKCSLIAILMQDTDIYLFDEPTNTLDTAHCKIFCKELQKIIEKDRILIVVTHDVKHFSGIEYEEVHLS